MGEVAAIHIGVGSRIPMKSLDEVQILDDFGLEGDRKAKAGSRRQVLLVSAEALEHHGLQPGVIRENITTRGIDVDALPRGAVLLVGEARLEVTFPCAPCGLLDDIRPGLQEQMRGQRGVLCRVISGGRVRTGDRILVTA